MDLPTKPLCSSPPPSHCHCTALPRTRGEVVICSVQRCSKPLPLLQRGTGCIVAISSVIQFTGLGPPRGHTTTPLQPTVQIYTIYLLSLLNSSTSFINLNNPNPMYRSGSGWRTWWERNGALTICGRLGLGLGLGLGLFKGCEHTET